VPFRYRPRASLQVLCLEYCRWRSSRPMSVNALTAAAGAVLGRVKPGGLEGHAAAAAAYDQALFVTAACRLW
jgi:hypothetical protein